MDYSREKLIEIWSRALPGEPPPALFDTLTYPDGAHASPRPSGCAEVSEPETAGRLVPPCETQEAPCEYRPASDAPPPDAQLRRAVAAELELTVLYSALARFALAHPSSVRCETARSSRGVSRELMALANEEFAAAKSAASAYMLASGIYYFPAPPAPRFESLREGLRRAWRLERELAACYAGCESAPDCSGALRMHSAHSLTLCSLLGSIFG